YVDVVSPSPHEGADHRLGEEEPFRVASLDARDLDVGRHSDDAKAIRGCRDGAGGVGPVTMVILGSEPGNWRARHTVDAVGHVDVRLEIGMGEVDSCVDVSDQHGRTAPCDGMGLRGVDLPHVPLQCRERVSVTCWRVRYMTWRRTGCVGARTVVIVEP